MNKFTLEEWLEFVEDLKTSQTEFNAATDSPIFHVQAKKRAYGFDEGYSDSTCWVDTEEGTEYESAQNYYDEIEAGDKHLLNALAIEEYGAVFSDLSKTQKDEVLKLFAEDDLYLKKLRFKEYWEDVGVFLTRQEADWFIKRKGHDYQELRVYVKSLYFAPQHKRLIQAILTGEVKYVVEGGAV